MKPADKRVYDAVAERADGLCEASVGRVCVGRAELMHHRRLGRGPGTTTIELVINICAPCHKWIHDHPKEACERGLLVMDKYK